MGRPRRAVRAMWELDLALLPGTAPAVPAVPAEPVSVAAPVQRLPPVERVERVERVPSPELGNLFSAYERPPKRAKSAPPRVAKPEREVIAYHQRIVARPKAPFDPRHPFRNAGLMRDIGGVHGFMSVMRGEYRIVDEWETTSEVMVLN